MVVPMLRTIRLVVGLPFRHHFWGGLIIVVLVTLVIATRMTDRRNFANGELYQDVVDRWGAPIEQPAPSVRAVTSGSVWSTLQPVTLDHQIVRVNATMNYRKRGLVYFSGFDFQFSGSYRVSNPDDRDADIVFVFPLSTQKTEILLSDLEFVVDGKPADIDLAGEKLAWSGRLPAGAAADFEIRFKGRGLDSFVYKIDPALPVHNLDVELNIDGGENYDYPARVIPASAVTATPGKINVAWKYASLESGVPVGLILPSEQSFDEIITTMLYRSWATFMLFAVGIALIAIYFGRPLRIYEAYLAAAGYGFFFVLLAYLAAFVSFYTAYGAALVAVGGLLFTFLRQILPAAASPHLAGVLVASMVVPTAAVIFEGYTGLVYTLELLVLLALAMKLSADPAIRAILEPDAS